MDEAVLRIKLQDETAATEPRPVPPSALTPSVPAPQPVAPKPSSEAPEFNVRTLTKDIPLPGWLRSIFEKFVDAFQTYNESLVKQTEVLRSPPRPTPTTTPAVPPTAPEEDPFWQRIAKSSKTPVQIPPGSNFGAAPPVPAMIPPSAITAAGAGGGAAAGAAGAGGGAMAGLAAAAAPLAIAGAVVYALEKVIERIQAVAEAFGKLGLAFSDPGTNPANMVKAQGEFIAGIAKGIPIAEQFYGALGSAVGMLGSFMQAMDGMVERFAQYSPQLAFAQAQADVRQIFADMRRAQEVTPALLQYLQSRTEMQQHFEDAKMRFIDRAMPVAIRVMEISEHFMPYLEFILNVGLQVAELIPGIGESVRDIRNRMDQQEQANPADDPFEALRQGLVDLPER